MTCLHNHDQILEFLRKLFLKGFQIYQNYLCALILKISSRVDARRCLWGKLLSSMISNRQWLGTVLNVTYTLMSFEACYQLPTLLAYKLWENPQGLQNFRLILECLMPPYACIN